MSAQSSRLQNSFRGGEVLSLGSQRSFGANHYEPIFRDNVDFYLHSIEDVQSQVQQYHYSAQTSLQLARTLLSSNEMLLNNSINSVNVIAGELASRREEMGSFLFDQLSKHVSLSQQKTDAILDLYNSSVNLSKAVVKLTRFSSLCAMGVLSYSNLASEMVRSDNSSSMSAFAHDAMQMWERANRSNAASQGLSNGLLTLSQNIFEVYNSAQQITDKISSLSNTAAQFAGMN